MSLLPTKKRPASTGYQAFSLAIYGPPKGGKTWFANGFPDALFLATEPGHKGIECAVAECYTWAALVATLDEVVGLAKAGKCPFKTIVLDTIDAAYPMAEMAVCAENGAPSIVDGANSWGKGTSKARSKLLNLVKGLTRLADFGLMVICIGQAYTFESKSESKGESTTIVPFPKAIRSDLVALFDVLGYVEITAKRAEVTRDVIGTKHSLRTKSSRDYQAGDRTNKLPDEMPLTFSAYAQAFAIKEVK